VAVGPGVAVAVATGVEVLLAFDPVSGGALAAADAGATAAA
jgi:hypothetical protein